MALLEAILGLGIGIVLLIIVLALACYLFWLWMFIDALARRDTLWIALFIVCFFVAGLSGIIAFVYYITVYKKNKR